ncbi:MAG: hypothetical protein ACM3QS_13170 [Bacteroidota bacterium]
MLKIRGFLARTPFTIVMLCGLLVAGLLTNTYFERITHHWLNRTGFAPDDLWYLRLERLFTSAMVTSGGKAFWEAVFFIAFAVGLAEWMAGWRRAAATFWGVHLLALILLSLIISLSLRQLRAFGIAASEVARDVGPSAGYFACLGLASARLKRPWHWISGATLFPLFILAFAVPAPAGESARVNFSANLAHLFAFPLGWLSSFVRSSPKSTLGMRESR